MPKLNPEELQAIRAHLREVIEGFDLHIDFDMQYTKADKFIALLLADRDALEQEVERLQGLHDTAASFTEKELVHWLKETQKTYDTGREWGPDDMFWVCAKYIQTAERKLARLVAIEIGAIPESTDYAKGWNECRQRVRELINEARKESK